MWLEFVPNILHIEYFDGCLHYMGESSNFPKPEL